MPSYNKVMDKWHAYKRAEGETIRINLGYYQTREDAVEAEKLGRKTEKRWSAKKRNEEAGRILAARYSRNGDSSARKGSPSDRDGDARG